jgi:competence protein ComFC
MNECYIIKIMRCISCESLSIKIICNRCQSNLLKPSFYKRELEKGFFVYSFYNYEDIKEFLNSKYEFYGDRIYKTLGNIAFKKFSKNFEYHDKIYSIAIDDHTRHNFSHTAILSNQLKSNKIQPIHDTLKATNIVKYAGKNLTFRENNKRKFHYSGKENLQVILVDDIITTGSTILEAKQCLEENNCEVLFALTLTDAKLS